MPRVKRKIVDDQIYEAWQAFAADGVPGVIATGTRLRGSDPLVKAHPHWFVTAGSPPSEWPTELGTTEAPKPKPDPSCDIKLQVEPRPLDRVVELTRPVKVLVEAACTAGSPVRCWSSTKSPVSKPTPNSWAGYPTRLGRSDA